MRCLTHIFALLGLMMVGFTCPITIETDYKRVQGNTSDSLLLWSDSFGLSWDDFQGIPDSESKYKALTYVQIGLHSKQFDDSIVVDVPTYFYKKLSWSKSLNNSTLLGHEQLHFDIGELMARKIRKEYSMYELTDFEIAYKELKRIYRRHFGDEFDRYHRNYDEQTEHGTISSMQKEWELKIAKELKALEAYSSTGVTIKKLK